MGIHSDWVKTFKREAPTAFTDTLSTFVCAGFIDGQIQLMKSRNVVSWDQFVQYQFVLPIQRLLRMHGAKTVVLAFDDYEHVPAAKGMTQAKRAARANPIEFHEREQLPPLIPDYWDRAILNRNFKTRVIQMVIARLPALLALKDDESLIIDYKGPPRAFGPRFDTAGNEMDDFEPVGEADLKFFRYAEYFGSLLTVTTDSDYIPIALLRLEANERAQKIQPRIFIRRLRVGDANGDAAKKETGRATEIVDLNELRSCLTNVLTSRHSFFDDGFCMARLCALIALFGGTDFSRGMPLIGPKRVWDHLHLVTRDVMRSFNVDDGQLCTCTTPQTLVSSMYSAVFVSHTRGVHGLTRVFRALQRSKLSARSKEKMPSPEYIETSVRNANWIVLYWGGDTRPPDETFGYRRKGAKVVYADL